MSLPTPTFDVAAAHRHFAADCFNKTWELMRKPDRSIAENRMMLAMAHTSLFHWSQRADCAPRNLCIGYWQLSRVYALLNDAGHARVCGELALEFSANLEPFYAGYAYEALARADSVAGNKDGAATYIAAARKCAEQVADATDRETLVKDLDSIA